MSAYTEPATLHTDGSNARLAAHSIGARIDTSIVPDRDEQHPGRDWDAWAAASGYWRTNPGQEPAHFIQVARCQNHPAPKPPTR